VTWVEVQEIDGFRRPHGAGRNRSAPHAVGGLEMYSSREGCHT